MLRQQGKWQWPSKGYLKLNFDGALLLDRNKAGVGMIPKDSQGETWLAASLPEDGIYDP